MGPARFSIDIKVLKDLRWHLVDGARGGQAPALRKKTPPLTVGRGPSPATRACERVPLAIARAIQRSRGTGPRATKKNVPITVGRGPVPRQRPRYGKNVSCSLQVCKT